MEPPTTPTKRAARPRFGRSYSASASTSPPQRSILGAQSASKKLHLHSLNHQNHDRSDKRHGDRGRAVQTIAKNVPGHAVVEKLGSSRSTGRYASNEHNSEATRSEPAVADTEAAPVKVPQRPARPEDVAKERLRRRVRDEEVRDAVGELSNFAQKSTRRLDNLFYSIMERVATLRSTIHDLQDLSLSSSQIHRDFNDETRELEKEYEGQIDNFHNFGGQQERVKTLETRVKMSMRRAQELSDRLEAARRRVELWEQRENAWQARTSLRLRVGWTLLGALIGLVLIVLIARQVMRLPGNSLGHARTSGKPLQNAPVSIPYWTEFYDDRTARTAASVLPSTNAALEKQSERLLKKLDEL